MEKQTILKKIIFWPSKKIILAIPTVLVLGFITGLIIDTSSLKQFILPIAMLMIYPTMIGFKPKEVLNFSHGRLMITIVLLNFIAIPIIAYLLGVGFLLSEPQLFAGLAITALLPTSNMTIAFTMLAKGNVPAAIKSTTTGLLLGSILAPWYLLVMVGQYVPIDILLTLKTISLIILVPLILGIITYSYIIKKHSLEYFQKSIKPYLPVASSWGMILIIFISISMNATRIVSSLNIFLIALLVQAIFYVINYSLAIFFGRKMFNPQDGLTLVFSTALRNLSIAIGLAATAFGPNAALMVSLAFLIQGQAAAWFIKLNERYGLLNKGDLSTKRI
ncbi:MAG: sodium:proton symporter [Gracilibacter sp. BRH_c7a]|nr:MAG: sodium:proton symporter [Gracilibacter sp. BRH_c7a]